MRLLLSLLVLVLLQASMQPAMVFAGELRLAPGEALQAEHVQALLAPALPSPPEGRRLAIRVVSPRLPLVNAAASSVVLRLQALRREGEGFTAELEVAVENGPVNPLILSGEVRTSLAVPVPTLPLAAGHAMREQDLTPGWIDEDALGEDTVLDWRDVLEKETVRRLPAGRPLRRGDLRPARLVRRGEPVSIRFGQPGLEITARGVAVSDAALGETLQVVNVDSERTIRARVTGQGSVEVLAVSPATAAVAPGPAAAAPGPARAWASSVAERDR